MADPLTTAYEAYTEAHLGQMAAAQRLNDLGQEVANTLYAIIPVLDTVRYQGAPIEYLDMVRDKLASLLRKMPHE